MTSKVTSVVAPSENQTLKVALIQTNASGTKPANIAQAFELVRQACAAEKPDLVVLPEMFPFYSADRTAMLANAEDVPNGPLYRDLGDLARTEGIYLHAGSILETGVAGRFNTTLVFNPEGDEIARYRKIHRFDITAPDGTVYRESDVFNAGEQVATYTVKGFNLGCAICYDLRFSELFLALQERGVDVIVLPAAFTYQTGRDHWEILVRARAIETQTYMLATGQTGRHDGGARQTWGHSMIVNPWGQLLADAGDTTGFVTATLEKPEVEIVRARVPVRAHRRARGSVLT